MASVIFPGAVKADVFALKGQHLGFGVCVGQRVIPAVQFARQVFPQGNGIQKSSPCAGSSRRIRPGQRRKQIIAAKPCRPDDFHLRLRLVHDVGRPAVAEDELDDSLPLGQRHAQVPEYLSSEPRACAAVASGSDLPILLNSGRRFAAVVQQCGCDQSFLVCLG